MDDIKTANKFGWGGCGFAGVITSPEKAVATIVKQPDAIETFQSLLTGSTPAGQLYALSGLRYKSPTDFQTAITTHNFESRTENVTVYMGCMHRPQKFNELVKELKEGKMDAYFTRWSK